MSREVQQMFASIAGRYDRANTVLSLGVHHHWRQVAIAFSGIKPASTVVDLCTGTGDLAFALSKHVGPQGKVIGVDFVFEMLELAEEKRAARNVCSEQLRFVHGDALRTPLPDASADAATIAFGIRNLDDPLQGLLEMKRILRDDGLAVILEFGQVTLPGFAWLYQQYSDRVMPIIGGLLTGNQAAYRYLPKTSREFPAGSRFLSLMKEAGFTNLKSKPLFSGIAYVYVGSK